MVLCFVLCWEGFGDRFWSAREGFSRGARSGAKVRMLGTKSSVLHTPGKHSLFVKNIY